MPPSRGQFAVIASVMQAIQDAVTGRRPHLAALRTAVEAAGGDDPDLAQAVHALEDGDLVAAKASVRCAMVSVLERGAEPDRP